MNISRSLLSSTSVLALLASSATPALAATIRPLSIRGRYENTQSYVVNNAPVVRTVAQPDATGRTLLTRSQVRLAQRNYRRHILGYLRGMDYRVLNTAGDTRTQRMADTTTELPLSLVQTGKNSSVSQNFRPNPRSVHDGGYYGDRVINRDRDILSEIENSSR